MEPASISYRNIRRVSNWRRALKWARDYVGRLMSIALDAAQP